MNRQIIRNYITPPHPIAFGGVNNVIRHFKAKRHRVEDALASIHSYTMHREYKKPKFRNPFFVYFPREQVQIDLIDMQALSEWNDDIRYILVAIDVFTKKVFLSPMINKTGVATLAALKSVIGEMHTHPKFVLFDMGKEFLNAPVLTYLERMNIKVIKAKSDVKAGVAERVNRTLKDIIYKFMTENETRHYLRRLQDMLSIYNNRYHRTIKCTPNEAELPENYQKVLNHHNARYDKILKRRGKRPIKLQVGDRVRLKTTRFGAFGRGFDERWTTEIFTIEQVKVRMPIHQYTVRSMNNDELIEGSFYENELQKLVGDVYRVDRIIRRRIRGGRRQVLIKWMGFDDQHNSWENAANVVRDYAN